MEEGRWQHYEPDINENMNFVDEKKLGVKSVKYLKTQYKALTPKTAALEFCITF